MLWCWPRSYVPLREATYLLEYRPSHSWLNHPQLRLTPPQVALALAKKLILLRGKVQGTDSLLIMLDTEMLDACHAAVPFAVFADFGEC